MRLNRAFMRVEGETGDVLRMIREEGGWWQGHGVIG
jgi:hypothetical protein